MASSQPRKTPIDAGMIARVTAGVRLAFTGRLDDAWFGPQDPLPPMAPPEVAGRQFDYPVGFNLSQEPRAYEAVSFAQMRALADGYDLLRLLIETRKDQVCNLKWSVVPKDDKAQPDARCDAINAFLALPDQEHGWQEWLRMILEDMLVIDATTIYPRRNRGGGLYALEAIDGATVKRVLDQAGRTPLPPDPAYQQVLKGVPAVSYTREELIYVPRNPRTSRVYGYSPVEQIIMTVNIALRRQVHQLQFYTEGNIPEALIGVPPEWSADQIAQFQNYFDAMLEGQTGARRHAKFVPAGFNVFETKAGALKDEYDEWLARVCCFAFSIEPTPFVKQTNRATSDTAREQSLAEGLVPIMNWVKALMDRCIAAPSMFAAPDLEFAWSDEEAIDPLVQAQVNEIYVNAGVLDPDEVRVDTLGKPPLTAEQREKMAPPPVAPPGAEPGAKPGQAEDGSPQATGDDAATKLQKKKHRHSGVTRTL